MYFPVTTQTPETVEEKINTNGSVAGGTETIFLVEDEPVLREMARDILESFGYRILEASSGKEALGMWTLTRGKIDLLLTDMIMPGGIGLRGP